MTDTARSELRKLILAVECHLKDLGVIVALPSTVERGKMLAKSANQLELCKDIAKRYGLQKKKGGDA